MESPGGALATQSWILCLLFVATTGHTPAFGAEPATAGPLWQEFPLTFETGERTEALGPFWATERRWPEDWEPSGAEPDPPVTEIARTFTLAPLFNWNAEPARRQRLLGFRLPGDHVRPLRRRVPVAGLPDAELLGRPDPGRGPGARRSP